ncbi:MAG: PQQ-dependent sugar dehydrogenase [Acidobacteria bacterium]|nr:PQQ-dependent sugar dehydrogenase [Acidobacteriota bacterium]
MATPRPVSLSAAAALVALLTVPTLSLSGPAPLAASGGQPAPAAPSPQPASLKVPPGFSVSVFASGLPGARLMAVSPEGIVVVARRTEVVALPDANGDGTAEPTVLVDGLGYAHSVAFKDGFLYIGTTAAVLRAKWAAGAVAGPVETYVTLPSSTPALHTSRSIAFGTDGRLYVGIGSSCNVCVETDARRTTIQVYDGPGSTGRTFAAGLHNAVGFDWDPATGRLWSADTGQEQLGDDYPPDEINLIEDGRHYGFPFFHGKSVASTVPELAGVPRTLTAADVVAPAFELPAHASPLGLTFYRGTAFPPAYRPSIYVAIHGSSQRSSKIGYSVARIVMQDGRPVKSEDFVTGWLSGDAVSGRPAGLVTGADGALYISDDNKGFIYRVAAAQAATPASGATSRPLLTERLPALNGAMLDARLVEVTYGPGGTSTAHRHPCPVVGYVLEGALRMQLAGQPERIVRVGESFYESPADVHTVSANASDTAPARFLAYFTCDHATPTSLPVPPPLH